VHSFSPQSAAQRTGQDMARGGLGKMPEGTTPFPPAVVRIFERFERIEPIIAHRRPKHMGMMHLAPLLSAPPPLQKYLGDDQAHLRRRARSSSRRKAPKPLQGSAPSPPSTPRSPEPSQDAPRPPAGQRPPLRRPMPPPPWLTPHWDPLESEQFLPVPPLAANLASGVYGAPVVPGLPGSRRFRRRRQRSAHDSSPARSPSPQLPAQKSADGRSLSPQGHFYPTPPSTDPARGMKHRPSKAQKAARSEAGLAASTANTSQKAACRAPPNRQLVRVVINGVFQRVAERADILSATPAAPPAEAAAGPEATKDSCDSGVLAQALAESKAQRHPFQLRPSVGSWLQPRLAVTSAARAAGLQLDAGAHFKRLPSVETRLPQAPFRGTPNGSQSAAFNLSEEDKQVLQDYAEDITCSIFDDLYLEDQVDTGDLVTDLDLEG